jgi:amino acid permease
MRQVPNEKRRKKMKIRLAVIAVLSAAVLLLVSPTVSTVGAITCNNDSAFWTPEPDATYSQTATACVGGFMSVSSSANVSTLVPQSGSYTFTACKVPTGQLAFCTRSNTVFTKTVNTGVGVFPNDSKTFSSNGANTWNTSLDVTVKDTTTGATNTLSDFTCATSLPGGCPV